MIISLNPEYISSLESVVCAGESQCRQSLRFFVVFLSFVFLLLVRASFFLLSSLLLLDRLFLVFFFHFSTGTMSARRLQLWGIDPSLVLPGTLRATPPQRRAPPTVSAFIIVSWCIGVYIIPFASIVYTACIECTRDAWVRRKSAAFSLHTLYVTESERLAKLLLKY